MKKILLSVMVLGALTCLAQAQSSADVRVISEANKSIQAAKRAPKPWYKQSTATLDMNRAKAIAGNNPFLEAPVKYDYQGRYREVGFADIYGHDEKGNTLLSEVAREDAGRSYEYGRVRKLVEMGAESRPDYRGVSPVGAAVEGAVQKGGGACHGVVCDLIDGGVEVTQKDLNIANKAVKQGKLRTETRDRIAEKLQQQIQAQAAAQQGAAPVVAEPQAATK